MIKLLKFLTKLDLTFDEILNNHVFSFAPFDKKCNRIYLVSKQLFDYAKQGDHVNVKYMLDKNRYLVFAYDNVNTFKIVLFDTTSLGMQIKPL